jgi:hypothetical protein
MVGIRFRLGAGLLLAVSLITASLIASASSHDGYQDFATDEFYEVWERTDRPVEEQIVNRTWMWGPGATTPLLQEPYLEADDGFRDVQYTDKSRMEMPWLADADPGSPWFITQGLLATELMTGRLQVGDNTFEQHAPSNHPAAGDPDGVTAPSYATMGMLMNADPRSADQVITQFMHSSGQIEDLEHLAIYGATDEYFVQETGFYVASPFWAFMTSVGPIYEGGILQQGMIVPNPFYAFGFPTGPAVWAWVKVDNVKQNVLIQCFERRCATFTPDNPEGWQVESGNVGQHYYHWRYHEIVVPAPPVDDDDVADDVADDDAADDAADDIDDGVDDTDPPPQAQTFTVTPPTATNLVNTSHTITVLVETDDDEPVANANVFATVIGDESPHQGTDLSPSLATTGPDGMTTLSYTGTSTGTDTIEVTVVGLGDTQTVTKTWADYVIEFDPDDAENLVGSSYTLLATLRDADGEIDLADDDSVSVSISREDASGTDDFDDFDTATNDDEDYDRLEISYTGPTEPATDTITVSVTIDVDGEDEVITGSTTKTWVPYTLTLSHDDAENEVNTPHTFTGTLTGIDGDENVEIDDVESINISREFDDGSTDPLDLDPEDPDVSVDINGNTVTVEYPGPEKTAVDTIHMTVSVETENRDIKATSEQALTKTWVAGDPAEIFLAHVEEELDPDDFDPTVNDTNAVGTPHTVYALAVDEFGNPVQDGTEIDFIVTDPLGNTLVHADGTEQTAGGIASFTYTGPTEPREDGITASWGDAEPPDPSSNTVIKEWVPGDPALLTLELWFDHPSEEQSHTNGIGERHHVVAEVEDQYGNAIPDAPVTFSLTEDDPNDPVTDLEEYGTFDPDHPSPGSTIVKTTVGETNDDGRIGFLYDGELPGADTIIATVTGSTDPNLTDTSDKFWCSAIVVDGESIQAAVDGVGDNALICVEAGSYGEVELDKEGLTLWSFDGAEETTITSGTTDDKGVVFVSANNVTIDGFTIDNENAANGRAIRVMGSTESTTIVNNTLVNSTRGVQGDYQSGGDRSVSGLQISNNEINTDFGLAGTEEISGLEIESNTFNTSTEGIGLGEDVVVDSIESNHFAGDGDHIRDYRAAPDFGLLDDVLANNTFDRAVVVRDNPIVVPAIFSSIQAAVDEASSGEIVDVMPGTYEELVHVDVDDLSLIGSGIGNSIIDGPADAQPQGAVDIDADNVTVQGFTVIKRDVNQNRVAIGVMDGRTGTTLRDLDVSAPSYDVEAAGEPIIGSVQFGQPIGDITIDNVTTDRSIGISLLADAEVTITNSTVSDSNTEGIWLFWNGAAGAVTITDNDVQNSYRGGGSGAELILHQLPPTVNGEAGLTAEAAADRLFCDNLIEMSQVAGETSISCPPS